MKEEQKRKVSCGKQFDVYGDSRRKYCSHGCYIKSRFGGGGADSRSGAKTVITFR